MIVQVNCLRAISGCWERLLQFEDYVTDVGFVVWCFCALVIEIVIS